MSNPKKGNLYLIPTLLASETEDMIVSPQIKSLLSEIKYYIVENVKTTRRFISALKLNVAIDGLTFYELNKKTSEQDLPRMLNPLGGGNDMGLISEAGVPCVADPGKSIVQIAHQKNIRVVPVSGPSSIVLALMASGFNGQQFAFHGYLPIDKKERQKALNRLEQEVNKSGYTQIFMETPYRNSKLITDLLEVLNPKTRLCIAANITGASEFIGTNTVKFWSKNRPELGKVPAIYLLGV